MKCVADGGESSKVKESCLPFLSLGPFWVNYCSQNIQPFFSSFWVSLSLSFILDDAPEVGDPPALWSKLDAKGLLLLPLRSRLDRELLILLRVLVMPLVWRRDRTGLSRRSSKMGALSTVCSSQEAQSGILLSWLYRSLVTERSARTSRAPNIAPGRTVLLLEW